MEILGHGMASWAAVGLLLMAGCTTETIEDVTVVEAGVDGVARVGFDDVVGDELRFAGFVPDELVLVDPQGAGYVWLELVVSHWCLDEGVTVEPPVDFMLPTDGGGRFEGALDISWPAPGGDTPLCGVHSYPTLSVVDCSEIATDPADVIFCSADTRLDAWDVEVP